MSTLSTSTYTLPGAYIGKIIEPNVTVLSGIPRLPCYVGKGSRLATVRNAAIRRSYKSDVELTFSSRAPFQAPLTYYADGNQELARLYDSNGAEIDKNKWQFKLSGSDYSIVEFDSRFYDSTKTYYIDYQSVDRTVLDPTPYEDIRTVDKVSVTTDTEEFVEYEDFIVVMTYDEYTVEETQTKHDKEVSAIVHTGTGTFTHSLTGTPTHKYNRYYKVTCIRAVTASIGGVLYWYSVPISGGKLTDSPTLDPIQPQNPVDITDDLDYNLHILNVEANKVADQDFLLENGITLRINTNAGATIVLNDTLEFNSYGPGIFERIEEYSNANQYPEAYDSIEETSALTKTGEWGTVFGDAITLTADHIAVADLSTLTVTCIDEDGTSTPVTTAKLGDGPYPEDMHPVELAADVQEKVRAAGAGVTELEEFTCVYDPSVGTDGAFTCRIGGSSSGASAAQRSLTIADAVGTVGASMKLTAATKKYSSGANLTTNAGLSINATSAYTGDYNKNYKLRVVSVNSGTDTAVVYWTSYGTNLDSSTLGFKSGYFTLDWTDPTDVVRVEIEEGIYVDCDVDGSTKILQVGDSWTIAARCPVFRITAKDTRDYTITVASVTPAGSDPTKSGTVGISYYTSTPEGGFGSTTFNNPGVLGDMSANTELRTLSGNFVIACRNIAGDIRHSVTVSGANDKWSTGLVNTNYIDWSLGERVSETFQTSDILHDVYGNITGYADTYYVILAHTVLSTLDVVSIVKTGNIVISGSIYGTSGSPYLWFTTDPGAAITVTYDHRGDEPTPGDIYYFTASYVRPSTSYDSPFRVLTRDDAFTLLAPAASDNDLYIMADLAFDNAVSGIYVCQASDSDLDGNYTTQDYKRAIEATEGQPEVTDLIVLNKASALPDAIASNVRTSNPFARKFRMLWWGCSTGTTIGSETESGTLIYTARKTLQVYGNSPAHGTRVLVAPTTATKTIILPTGQAYACPLNGSFVAGQIAALNASFSEPADTLLWKTLPGFDEIEVYTTPENILLGGASILFMEDIGSGVYRCGESITVDTSSIEYHEVSAMNQQIYVTAYVRQSVEEAVVSMVPDGVPDGLAMVRGAVVLALKTLLSQNKIATYEDDQGNERQLNPITDVIVFRDTTDRTLYHFKYAYYLRYPIKRLFGLYTVDSNNFANA